MAARNRLAGERLCIGKEAARNGKYIFFFVQNRRSVHTFVTIMLQPVVILVAERGKSEENPMHESGCDRKKRRGQPSKNKVICKKNVCFGENLQFSNNAVTTL